MAKNNIDDLFIVENVKQYENDKEKITVLEKENNALKMQVAKFETEKSEQSQKLFKMKQENAELKNNLNKNSKLIETLKQDKNTIERNYQITIDKLIELKNHNEELEKQFESVFKGSTQSIF